MLSLEGRRILVTGCGGGIGSAICKAVAELGAELIATDLNDAGAAVAAQADGHYLPLDVTDEASWQAAATFVEAKFGALEGLVNNAGVILMKSIRDTSLSEYRRVNQVNHEGTFRALKHCLPLLAKLTVVVLPPALSLNRSCEPFNVLTIQ